MITIRPEELLKKIAPASRLKRILNKNLSVNKTLLSTLSEIPFIKKKDLTETVLNTKELYLEKTKDLQKKGMSKNAASAAALNQKKMLAARLQSLIIYKLSEKISEDLYGEFFIWLPSSANDPDPEHQLRYGKTYQVGKDELPGERFGCKCGMEILTKKTELDLF